MTQQILLRPPWLAPSGEQYLLSGNHVLFPAFADSEDYNGGAWSGFSDSSETWFNPYNASPPASVDGSWLEWDDVVLPAGDYEATLIHEANNGVGIYGLRIGGTEVDTADGYAASQTKNSKATFTWTQAATEKTTIRLETNGKNASSSGYNQNVQALFIRRTDTNLVYGGAEFLPWRIPLFPDAYKDISDVTYDNYHEYSMDSLLYTDVATGRYIELEAFTAAGTFRLDLNHYKYPNRGIFDLSIDSGADLLSWDLYGSLDRNVNTATSTFSIGSVGYHTLRLHSDTKNASSTGYAISPSMFELRRIA